MSFLPYVLIGMALAFIAVIMKSRYVSFWGQSISDYPEGPQFDIRERFNGAIQCEGVIYGPTGRVSSRFVAEFDAVWKGNVCVMKEIFHYDSGNVQNREWKFTLGNDGKFNAEAPDVIGTGLGEQKGSAVLLNYRIKLTEEAGGHELDVTDWMYLMQNGSIMNRSQFRKFGFKVAELVATMRPKEISYAGE
ncbi:Protein of unknown function [Cognatiyoonia koreensis]|uniref:DUF3833 domain-containing protein n=1 Tax=Cognatiyoonia koreensis TaxID=364200 RepID=A0A1I0RVP0_9RHOB|nr:DUF3833 family protein [Cognatiyoonia koreensis]SEW45364.1 Protein of unknown function [Cognatiyoonia koreensis]